LPAFGLLLAMLVGGATVSAQPIEPVPMLPAAQPVSLSSSTTALLVLDLSARCDNPQEPCSQLAPTLRPLVDRARASGLLIAYSVSASARGTPLGEVWGGFERAPDEPVFYPDAFDKFVGGDLKAALDSRGITDLVLTGSATNVAVLYTASSAARLYGYKVVIPMDAMNAATLFEHQYAIYQLTRLPTVADKFTFTRMNMLDFTVDPG
jgi:nicotinamidase-related amidase